MKIPWFALLALLLSLRLSVAQEAPVAVIPEKISYSPSIPKALKAFLPRGGKSRFWGQTKLRFENKPVWAWVYDAKKTYFKHGESNTNGIQKSGLDLFVFARPNRLKRISSTRFNYPRWGAYDRGGDFETVGLESTWLDLKTRKRPVLRIHMQNPDGLYGLMTEDVLAVFEADLKKPVTQTGFGEGSSNGAGWNSWTTRFTMDEASQLNLIYAEGSFEGKRETTYKWRNNRFRPFSRIQRGNSEGDEYKSVPLTED